jgi:hypothetical protein
VLVEGRTRFVPGTRITVHFDGGFSPAKMKGKVVRCHVSSISDGMLCYQSGIQFENRLDTNPGEMAVALTQVEKAVALTGLPNPPGGLSTEQAASAGAAAAAAPVPRRVVNRW